MEASAAMTDLNLLDTEIEQDLRASLRDMLADRCAPTAVAAGYDGDRGLVAPLWKAVTEDLGLAGLLVAEEYGGAGASAREAAVVMEELGRAAAPVPYLTSAVVATTVLTGGDSDLLGGLATGQVTAALAVPLATPPWRSLPTVLADGGRLTGEVRGVAGALDADVLLVPVDGPDGVRVHAVRSEQATIVPVVSLDMTRQLVDVELDGVRGEVVVEDAGGRIAAALALGAAMLSSEEVGVARQCQEMTVAYLKQRRQFGRVVGGFQALKHRLTDLALGAESALAAARYAAATWAAMDDDREVATCVAQAFCGDFAVRAAEEAIQLHGGIGMSWEHPAHLYLKRAKADQIALGTSGFHRARLARLVDLPGAEADGC
jgi:alkylation response protein AidB-like acyl-CoA dehydrogenase